MNRRSFLAGLLGAPLIGKAAQAALHPAKDEPPLPNLANQALGIPQPGNQHVFQRAITLDATICVRCGYAYTGLDELERKPVSTYCPGISTATGTWTCRVVQPDGSLKELPMSQAYLKHC